MRDEFIRRAHSNPRLHQELIVLATRLSEATGHEITIRVVGYSPPVFTVVVDRTQVDPWMPWEQTVMFLQGILTGFALADGERSYDDGVAWATAQVQQALIQALSQDRDGDTVVSTV